MRVLTAHARAAPHARTTSLTSLTSLSPLSLSGVAHSDYNAISAYDDFLRYKERVPVCGAILLSDTWDKCLLVRGWKSGASWSFPRGKINQGELERDCCVREVSLCQCSVSLAAGMERENARLTL